jgi:glyoxylase-like metal-dependent hydrolase (beta-lactamase superfamily II)/rhodanese-related sulfurtransferase
VLENIERYLLLLDELDLTLVKAIDTHVHADHITALGALRDRTRCVTVMGAESKVDVVSMRVGDGDRIEIDGVSLEAIHTPGHTDDSYCFRLPDRVFTGDTLFIRGTGRTDFQHGDPAAQYRSIFDKLLSLPDDTLVYPGHDYKGGTVSTIGEERAWNPRLQVESLEAYVVQMNSLDLANPRMMDVAVPANLRIGLTQEELEAKGCSLAYGEAARLIGQPESVLIDLRDRAERTRHGVIAGSLHVPYVDLDRQVGPGGLLHELALGAGKKVIFYCAYGERSAMAVEAALRAGIAEACHIKGGLDAWKTAGGEVVMPEEA